MFEESGRALPLPTQIVISMGEFLQQDWWLILLVAASGYFLWNRQMSNPDSRYRWDQRFLGLPLIGDMIAKIEVARFSRTLGTLFQQRCVTILDGLWVLSRKHSGTVSWPISLTMSPRSCARAQAWGALFPFLEAGVFPRMAVHMVMVGEETAGSRRC